MLYPVLGAVRGGQVLFHLALEDVFPEPVRAEQECVPSRPERLKVRVYLQLPVLTEGAVDAVAVLVETYLGLRDVPEHDGYLRGAVVAGLMHQLAVEEVVYPRVAHVRPGGLHAAYRQQRDRGLHGADGGLHPAHPLVRRADQIRQSDSVIIMGHRQSDLDAIGSAIGLLRMCKMCDVPSVIAVRSKATLAGQLLDVFNKAGEDHNFIEPEETYKLITPKTLLIVTDTYQKRLLEDQKIYEKCSRVVVIDHHRMAVGHIDNPILLYHEPFASSASELVCELLQFMPAQNNITQLEAQALLSGIMLDTPSFALHVGVRTFEAAAWLRSRGAETAATKRLFNISKEEYEARAAIVEGAYLYKGCAIATSDELDPAMSVVLPMAANDLLTIIGVDASFVAIAKYGGVNISARSMGALNVQVILEPLGGGGHLTMAGAQLRDCTVKEAEARIRAQIDEYRANQECQEELVGAV